MIYKISNSSFYNYQNKLLLIKYFFNFLYIYFFYKNNSLSIISSKNFKLNKLYFNYIYLLYVGIIRVTNLWITYNFSKNFILNKISIVHLPKKYKLYTLLRSPHIDKRSREQFHIIENKTIVYAPVLLNLSKFSLLDIIFNFKKGYNITILNKKLI